MELAQSEGPRRGVARDPGCRWSSALDAELYDDDERAEASLAEAKLLVRHHGVTAEGPNRPCPLIGQAIVQEAEGPGGRPDRSRLGAARRRQSRSFSPTVDDVLKKAPSEVLIVAFPEGVLEEDGAEHQG